MRTLKFQIRHPQGQIEVVSVEAERALIGSGAHCEIRLGIDQARVEHVRIDMGPAGVFATALSFEPPPTLNGVPITQAPYPPDSVLTVGNTQIQVMLVDSAGTGATQQQTKKSSPFTVIMILVCGLAGAYIALAPDGDAPADAAAVPLAPQLWAEGAAPVCPQPAGPNALAYGRDRLALAEGHRERRPFFVADGVKAVPLFEVASACLRAGEDAQTAKYAADSAAYMRQDLKRDYRKFQVRLDRHLQTEEAEAARRDVHQLLSFTESFPADPYRKWLLEQNHNLDLKVGTGAAGASTQ